MTAYRYELAEFNRKMLLDSSVILRVFRILAGQLSIVERMLEVAQIAPKKPASAKIAWKDNRHAAAGLVTQCPLCLRVETSC
jgi:hypothetical protein